MGFGSASVTKRKKPTQVNVTIAPRANILRLHCVLLIAIAPIPFFKAYAQAA